MSANEERLPRLLAMVPYFLAHQGISAAEAAADFGITEKQLRRDLDLLWMCGLPGHGPGDLIDLSYEGDTVTVVFDAGMSRPLRLTNEEALALVVALRTLAETPGITDSDAVVRALAKVERAAGGEVDDTTVAIELDGETRLVPVLRHALEAGKALLLRYYTATRDETTERIVDPLRVFEVDRHVYLEAWCRRAEGLRMFRVDRIEHVEELAEASRPPDGIELRDLNEGVYQPASEHLLALLRLCPAYFWVADYYSTENVAEVDGLLEVSLRVADPAWVRALVLGSAGQVEVLSPDWLAESIHAEAATALAAYAAK
ncbi:MAG: YafY family transcriptional regulator [Actinomycetota bacterium]|nr:YafY family transcriptional regulator [Actinomycetota bacterium]